MQRVALVGEGGHLQRVLLALLLADGADVTVVVAAARALAGMEGCRPAVVRDGDAAALASALAGCELVYELEASPGASGALAEAAARADAGRLVRVAPLGSPPPAVPARTAVTTVRSGPVIGIGSRWLDSLVRLVERLRVLPCPSWMRGRTQPVAVADLARCLRALAERPDAYGAIDVGGPDVVTYAEMVRVVARELRRRIALVDMPVTARGASRMALRTVAGRDDPLRALLAGGIPADALAEGPGPAALTGSEPMPFAAAVHVAIASTRRRVR
jgi:hypothetical protein